MVGATLASLLWLPVVCLLGSRLPGRAPGAPVSFESRAMPLNDRRGRGRGSL